jgi:hypothetical protein
MGETIDSNAEVGEWLKFLTENLKERRKKLTLLELARCVPIASK